MKKYKVSVVGATGLVGRTLVSILGEYAFPVEELRLFASGRSEGARLATAFGEATVHEACEEGIAGSDIVFFTAGAEVAARFAPAAAEDGALVVDNSSRFRKEKPLIVPEINIGDYDGGGLVANPNCSTIQAVLPLAVLRDKFGLVSVRYATYQAVSGSGQKGKSALYHALNGVLDGFYPCDISAACLPVIGGAGGDGYTEEEEKMAFETRKILHLPRLAVSATCVRVPVPNCHGVAVFAETEREFLPEAFAEALGRAKGVKVGFPLGTAADGRDDVIVGRIRRDRAAANGAAFFCTADNVRKGAAANAVQTAMALIGRGAI